MKNPSKPGLPTTGAVLAYLFKAFGIPIKGIAGLDYKSFGRLKSRELGAEAEEKIARRLIDEIYASIAKEKPDESITDEMLKKLEPISNSLE
jgi:hypothetical protein